VIPRSGNSRPRQAGQTRGNDGCPEVDYDGDGIVDRLEKVVRFDPQTIFNGVADDAGAPSRGRRGRASARITSS